MIFNNYLINKFVILKKILILILVAKILLLIILNMELLVFKKIFIILLGAIASEIKYINEIIDYLKNP